MSHRRHYEHLDWILVAVTSINVRLEISYWVTETDPPQRNVRLNREDQGGWTCDELRKWCRKNKIVLPKEYWY